jgi:conjugal transfer pilus assembly protein TrbC
VGIDPRLFRAFNVTAVPTYVVASTDFDLCDGFDCQTQVPPHDRISGNVTADFALETIARGGGPSARIASQYLARLKGTDQ